VLNPSVVGVIPARLESTRLPRKLLLDTTGEPLILHTLKQAMQAQCLKDSANSVRLYVATDSDEIARVVSHAGGVVVMTSGCESGTDRVAAAIEQGLDGFDIVVNIQGDEPEIDPTAIDRVVSLLLEDPDSEMATLCTPVRSLEELRASSCVKVVISSDRRALYFSRLPIPWASDFQGRDAPQPEELHQWKRHVGIYAYRTAFLRDFVNSAPGLLERTERLEQLRALELGATIRVAEIDESHPGIDTQADYAAFVSRTLQNRTGVI